MIKRYHFVVEGKVQGVFFRMFTKERADKHGLTGWVRNLSDGRVELEAQGEENVLKSFIDKDVKTGPPAAFVTNETAEPEERAVVEGETTFQVQRGRFDA